ncbi:MAG TPA: glycosyltransferase family 4 protein, partial [Candidatus Bathyarchaeia archaeon]|nr:glycosyltransferase family 4 protein [Candidatus Bathyarchaeia archaeon]
LSRNKGGLLRLLVWTCAYPPDPAAVGQYLADAAVGAARLGHRVRVITADRGYEDPRMRYPRYAIDRGVEVVRLGLSSFGKKSLAARLAGQISFSVQALFRGLCGPRPGLILVSTTPPFGIAGAWMLSVLRRVPLVYWVMDINPDQAVAMGMVAPRSVMARVLEGLNRLVLRSAARVITLDSRMADKLSRKAPIRRPIGIIPPWPQEETLSLVPDAGQAFRRAHGLQDKFVVMYSGNHSWVHPLDTVLRAARALEARSDIRFVFVGQGNDKGKVDEAVRRGAPNILSLPVQPQADLGESLAAADAHLVVMGEAMTGIVHPSKIYNAMLAGRPILAIAPPDSHISDIIALDHPGIRVDHGEDGRLAGTIAGLADMDPAERERMGLRARSLVRAQWDQRVLMGRLFEALEESAEEGRT